MAELTDAAWPPDDIITRRLILRETRASDRDDYVDLLASEEVRRYLGGASPREELEARAPDVPGRYPGFFAVEAGDGFVGAVMLDRRELHQPGHVRDAGGELEVSFTFLPTYWGRGYATEAVIGVLAWAARSLPDRDVVLCTQVANERSLRLAARLGFAEVARFELWDATQWFGVRNL